MSTYQSKYTGEQIDSAVTKVLSDGVTTRTIRASAVSIKNPISVEVKAETINLFSYWKNPNIVNNTLVDNGITYTYNEDGSITANGTTAETESTCVFSTAAAFPICLGDYYLTGCPSGGSLSTYYIKFDFKNETGVWGSFSDIGTGGKWTAESEYVSSSAQGAIRIYPGVTVENLTFYPMLSRVENADFAPLVCLEEEKLTVVDNEFNTTNALTINADGTVGDIPVYNDMTLTVPNGVIMDVTYQTVNNKNEEQIKALAEQTTDHERRIQTIENGEIVSSAIPSYFEEEINTTVETILEKSQNPCLILNILSDSHEDYTVNEQVRICNEMYANIKAVNERVYCDGLIHLGDSCGSPQAIYPDWQTVVRHLNSTRSRLSKCNNHSVMLVGNHDGINSLYPDEKKTFNAMYAYNRDYVKRNGKSPYGYMDFEDMKIRCVFLATNIYSDYSQRGITALGWEQVKWFAEVISQMEDGWQILAFAHYSPYDEAYEESNNYIASNQYRCLVRILNAFNIHTKLTFSYSTDISLDLDFTNKTSTKTIALFTGHGHYDRVIQNNTYVTDYELSYPIIMTACARLEQEDEKPDDNADGTADADVISPARMTKTVTQDLWDTMVYSPTENKIYMIRFGAGEDRVIDLTSSE